MAPETLPTSIHIGTAGWSVPKAVADRFPSDGTHLERYARVLPCVEINSSFYRPHKPETYARWAASTPAGFRFAADPAPVPAAAEPGGWDGLVYRRLHGSPEIYHSPYPAIALERIAGRLAAEAVRHPVWCIFDNTALGHATTDAWTVFSRVAG